MAPEVQPRRLTLVTTPTEQPAARSVATRVRAARGRIIAVLETWRAAAAQDPAMGADDLEWVWSFLRRDGAYNPRKTR
jgi:hypothetical protein